MVTPIEQPTPGARTPQQKPSNALGAREVTVLRLTALGYTNKEIGLAMRITPSTVSGHLDRIFHKLNVTNRVTAVVQGVRHGYVNPRYDELGQYAG